MYALITWSFNWCRRMWEGMRENFAQIFAWSVLLLSGGAFVLLLCWAFVGQDGETIYPRVAQADALGVFKWLVALAISGVVLVKSYNYLKRLRS